MDRPGTRTPTWLTPEQKRIAELEQRVEYLEGVIAQQHKVGLKIERERHDVAMANKALREAVRIVYGDFGLAEVEAKAALEAVLEVQDER